MHEVKLVYESVLMSSPITGPPAHRPTGPPAHRPTGSARAARWRALRRASRSASSS
ncbi:hypothetical protein [Streptomyces sp. NPDC001480]|uniref:hypothetical protein n=1 Tax=Streptomyces sp. NPDC001480 TaxID=3364577 RepID=UPI003695D0E9